MVFDWIRNNKPIGSFGKGRDKEQMRMLQALTETVRVYVENNVHGTIVQNDPVAKGVYDRGFDALEDYRRRSNAIQRSRSKIMYYDSRRL